METETVLINEDFPHRSQVTFVRNVYILPILTYGSQTWSLTKAQTEKLKSHTEDNEKKDTRNKNKRQWKLTGHMMRRDDNHWNNRLIQ